MKKRNKIILLSITSVIVLLIAFSIIKRVKPLSWGHNEVNQSLFSNQAINGYDTVAYFTENNAVIGNENYSYNWKNATWNFSSEENKSLFIKNPEKYAPQFGGYCAFAVGKGFTANTSPDSFQIIDGKLYLFANDDIKSDWSENIDENLRKCKVNWE